MNKYKIIDKMWPNDIEYEITDETDNFISIRRKDGQPIRLGKAGTFFVVFVNPNDERAGWESEPAIDLPFYIEGGHPALAKEPRQSDIPFDIDSLGIF